MDAVVLAICAGFFLGALGPALRHGLGRVRDAELGAFQSVAIGLATALVIAAIGGSLGGLDLGEAWPFLALGVFVPGISQVLFVRAIRDIGASRTLILTGTVPLITGFAAMLFLDEPFRLALLLGTLLVVSGGIALAWERSRPEDWVSTGVLWAVSGIALFATRDVVSRWITESRDVPPLDGAVCLLLGATATLACYLLVSRRNAGLAGQLAGSARHFLLAGLSFGAGYALLLEAFSRGKVTVVSPLNATYALWGTLISLLLMRRVEAVTPRVLLAAVLIVAGGAVVAATR